MCIRDRAESGEIYDFTLSLQEFDAEKEYIQDVRFWYDSTPGELGRQEETVPALAAVYDPNAEPGYLDQQIKQTPFNREMDVLDFDQYVVRSVSYTHLDVHKRQDEDRDRI